MFLAGTAGAGGVETDSCILPALLCLVSKALSRLDLPAPREEMM